MLQYNLTFHNTTISGTVGTLFADALINQR